MFAATGQAQGAASALMAVVRGHPPRSCVGLLGSASPSLREGEGFRFRIVGDVLGECEAFAF